jgi:RecA-family ATPase
MTDYVKGYGGGGVSWMVDGWLPDHSVTFLVSPPESYKTWLLLDLAVSVAAGVPFLGQFQINSPGPTLIIQQEDSHEGLVDRLALIAEQKLGAVPKLGDGEWEVPTMPDIPVYIHPSRMLRFDNKKVLDELEEQIKQIKPKVIMIDPLYSTTSVDNYMAASAEQMMILKTWRDKYGCSFVIAHHSKKNVDPDSTAREDSWGSQFLNAFLEAGWQIRRNSKLAQNEVVVRRHSKVMGNQAPISLTFNISTVYPMKYEVIARQYESQNAQGNPSRPAQGDLLDLMQDEEMSQAEICNRTGKSRSTVSRQIKQLEAAGYIVRMPSGKYKKKV